MKQTKQIKQKSKRISKKLEQVRNLSKEKQVEFVKKQVNKMKPTETSEARSYFVYWWKKLVF